LLRVPTFCPVAGNGFAGGFIVAATACCGQTIGGVAFMRSSDRLPPRGLSPLWSNRSGPARAPVPGLLCGRHGPLDCLHASRPLGYSMPQHPGNAFKVLSTPGLADHR
jgi:hypothetical protein